MDDVQRCHEALLQQRTQIRHQKTLLHWMKRCWLAVPHAAADAMTLDEYQDMYSILLYEMTICWEEELNDAILSKQWKRDAASYDTLNFDRFCCSIFYYVEMWVEEITLAEYEKIFCYVYRVVSGLGQQHLDASSSHSAPAPSSSYKPQEKTFKPTLESFNSELDNGRAMDELHMSFGKSISFNASQYCQHFGTPTTHLQAFHATLLQMQRRVRVDPHGEEERASRDSGLICRPEPRAGPGPNSTNDRKLVARPDRSPMKTLAATGRIDQLGSVSPPPPAHRRPMSSFGRARYILELDASSSSSGSTRPSCKEHMSAISPSSPSPSLHGCSPDRSRNIGDAFVLTVSYNDSNVLVDSPRRQKRAVLFAIVHLAIQHTIHPRDCVPAMHPSELTHLQLVRTRTRIRHDKLILQWMKRCWNAAIRTMRQSGDGGDHDPPTMLRGDYDAYYHKLLTAMTVRWEDHIWDEIMDEMWQRDAGPFTTIDFDRFCCSLFAFAEMWVNTLDTVDYVRVLTLIHSITCGATDEEPIIHRSNPSSLRAFLNELYAQKSLAEQNVSIGKSISFDADLFAQMFGSAMSLTATTPTLSSASARRPKQQPMVVPRFQQDRCRLSLRPRSSSPCIYTTTAHLPTAAASGSYGPAFVLHTYKAKRPSLQKNGS